ncbi:hypothetical protein OHV08_32720 [Streptomyces canus]
MERITGTAVLPTLHGCFSLGTVIGGSAGMAATAAAVPVSLVATGILVHAMHYWASAAVPEAWSAATSAPASNPTCPTPHSDSRSAPSPPASARCTRSRCAEH